MHEFYVFPHPTIAEGKPGLAAFQIDTEYDVEEIIAQKNKPSLDDKIQQMKNVEFGKKDVEQILTYYGIQSSVLVQADTMEQAIVLSGMDADKQIRSHFDADLFAMMNQAVSFQNTLKLNHAHPIAFDAYTYNLGLDIQNKPAGDISADHGKPIARIEIIEQFHEGKKYATAYKAARLLTDIRYEIPSDQDDFRNADNKLVRVPEGSLLIQMGNKYWDPLSYEVKPGFEQQAKEMLELRPLHGDNPGQAPQINFA